MPYNRGAQERFGLGWNRQRPDHRDYQFTPTGTAHVIQHDLSQFDLVPYLNQGQQGSCTGHAVAESAMWDQVNQGETVVPVSPAFIYYGARVAEGTQDQDVGAQVRDAFAVLINQGAAPSVDMPYNDQIFDVAPSPKAYADAAKEKALQYRATRYGSLRLTIASGYPFVFGFTVYENFYNIKADGKMPMPQGRVVGGHCVIARAYNDSVAGLPCPPRHFRLRNSWGQDWGYDGDFFMPYEYFDKGLCSDYWVLQRIA